MATARAGIPHDSLIQPPYAGREYAGADDGVRGDIAPVVTLVPLWTAVSIPHHSQFTLFNGVGVGQVQGPDGCLVHLD